MGGGSARFSARVLFSDVILLLILTTLANPSRKGEKMKHRVPANMHKHAFYFAFHYAQLYPQACRALNTIPAFAPLPLLEDPETGITEKGYNPAHCESLIKVCETAAAELPEEIRRWVLFGCSYDLNARVLFEKYGMGIDKKVYSRSRIAFYNKIAAQFSMQP